MGLCQKLFDICDCDALVVLSTSNTYYLSGYQSSNCQIVITKNKSYFITDLRYFNEASNLLKNDFEVLVGNYDTIKSLLVDCKRIGWDGEISYFDYVKLQSTLNDKNLVEISEKIQSLREIKQEYEIENILKAQKITEVAFDEALKFLKEGVSEIEVAAFIEYIFLKNGAGLAFDSIVAFGINGSTPHAHRTNKKLEVGEFVTMDIGAKYNGYCSDMTRTVALGRVSDKQIEVYNTVLEAQKKAINNIRPGMSGKEADKIARDYITEKGYGEYFTHSLGHAVGIDIHESFTFSPRNERKLAQNMIVTVEPGIYIDNLMGVRIEDMVICEENKVRTLTKSNKNLIIL